MKIEKIPIDLDKKRHLVYDWDAIYDLEQKYGTFMKAVQSLRITNIDDVTTLLYQGLKHEDESLTIEQVDLMIDATNRQQIIETIIRATAKAFPDSNKTEHPIAKSSPEPPGVWDWTWLLYTGTVLLLMPETVFWRSTPKKMFGLWAEHKKYHGLDKAEEEQKAKEAEAQAWINQYI